MGSFGGRLRHWRGLMLGNPLAFLAVFALGGLVAFVYSYVPLHTVKDQKIDRLERSLLAYEDTIATLEGEVERLRPIAARMPDVRRVATLESDRESAKREVGVLRGQLKKAKQRTSRLERERTTWKGRVAVLEKQLAETAIADERELRAESKSVAATAVVPPAAGAPDGVGDAPSALDGPQQPAPVPAAPAF